MKRFIRSVLIVLTLLLTISIEDTFLLINLMGSKKDYLFRGSFLSQPIILIFCFLLFLAIIIKPKKRYKELSILGFILVLSIMVGAFVGLKGKTLYSSSFFEFNYWRYLVFFVVLTYLFLYIWKDEKDIITFLNYFVIIQTLFALFSLVRYFLFDIGQQTHFGVTVPIFAGDQLYFLLLASFILSSQSMIKPSILGVLSQFILAFTLLLSMRRAVMAGFICSFSIPVFMKIISKGIISRKNLKVLFMASILAVLILISIKSILKINLELLTTRIKTINPFLASQSSWDTTTGHNDDFLDGFDNVKMSPLFGKGLNCYFELKRTGNWQDSNLHSTMFSLWIKLGLLGLFFYFYIVTFSIRSKYFRFQSYPFEIRALVIFIVSFALYDFPTTVYTNGIFMGFKGAFCLAIYMATCIFVKYKSPKLNDLGKKSLLNNISS